MNNKLAKVPWVAVMKDLDHFIPAEHQPVSGVVEPSKYHAEDLQKDCAHLEIYAEEGTPQILIPQ
jgi:hypothetical protein